MFLLKNDTSTLMIRFAWILFIMSWLDLEARIWRLKFAKTQFWSCNLKNEFYSLNFWICSFTFWSLWIPTPPSILEEDINRCQDLGSYPLIVPTFKRVYLSEFKDKYTGENALKSWECLLFNKIYFGQQMLTCVD